MSHNLCLKRIEFEQLKASKQSWRHQRGHKIHLQTRLYLLYSSSFVSSILSRCQRSNFANFVFLKIILDLISIIILNGQSKDPAKRLRLFVLCKVVSLASKQYIYNPVTSCFWSCFIAGCLFDVNKFHFSIMWPCWKSNMHRITCHKTSQESHRYSRLQPRYESYSWLMNHESFVNVYFKPLQILYTALDYL